MWVDVIGWLFGGGFKIGGGCMDQVNIKLKVLAIVRLSFSPFVKYSCTFCGIVVYLCQLETSSLPSMGVN